jgi:NAD(P)H-hydrate epimerase
MRVLTRKQSRALDRIAIDEMGIPGTTLMENAGKAVAEQALQMLESRGAAKVAVLCGKGHNGGDGFVAALQLKNAGVEVEVYALPEAKEIQGDPEFFYRQCREADLTVIHGSEILPTGSYRLIIDGLLGTGFRGELRSPIDRWTQWINAQQVPVLAIDVPSGVDANSGLVAESAVRATATVTMGYVKVGMLLQPGKSYCGNILPVDIGFPAILDQLPGAAWATSDEKLPEKYLTPPPADSYKHRQGKVLIIAGSTGMTGAATMSTLGALRTGVGLTVTCAPSSLNPIYEVNLMEGMTLSCEDAGRGYFGLDNYSEIEPFFTWSDVLLIGPGLGSAGATHNLVEKILLSYDKPIVIDADGLRVLAHDPHLITKIASPFVITPHYGELGAILERDHAAIKAELPEVLEDFMADFPGVLVAKNAPTCVAYRDRVVINTTGNQGLATAGTGDVLAGMIAGLIAQGIPLFEAAQLGVYLHGKAADKALTTRGYRGLLSSDLLDTIPEVIRSYELG